jgi:hypothetical protein
VHLVIERKRVESEGIFSQWSVDGEPFCVGVSRPWVDNKPFLSCIPAGDYSLVPWDSPKYGAVVAFVNPDLHIYLDAHDVKDERARDKCLIHAANFPHELQGCEAPGVAVVRFAVHGWGVTHSRRTLERLRSRWKDRRNLTARITWTDALRPPA